MKTLTLFKFYTTITSNLCLDNTSKLILILIVLFFIFYIPFYIHFKKIVKLINGKEDDNFIYYTTLRIHNKSELFLTIFYVFIYIVLNIALILYLRYIKLGVISNLPFIRVIDYFTFKIFIVLLCLLFLFYAYYQFTDTVIFVPLIKLYLYYYKQLVNSFDYLRDYRFFIKRRFLRDISFILAYVVDGSFREQEDRFRLYANEKIPFNVKLEHNIREYLFLHSKDSKRFYSICESLYNSLKFMRKYISGFLKEISLVLIVIVLIYDLKEKELYYIYYALFLYTVIRLYRKFMEFLWALDLYGII